MPHRNQVDLWERETPGDTHRSNKIVERRSNAILNLEPEISTHINLSDSGVFLPPEALRPIHHPQPDAKYKNSLQRQKTPKQPKAPDTYATRLQQENKILLELGF